MTYALDAIGTACVVAGVALLSIPGAVLVAGAFALLWATLLERKS
jgi:hypothetical protein